MAMWPTHRARRTHALALARWERKTRRRIREGTRPAVRREGKPQAEPIPDWVWDSLNRTPVRR